MSELPQRPDLDQLRRQARELQRGAAAGHPRAVTRLRAVSGSTTLSAAQLAIAREYGFPSWPSLKDEVERRRRTCAPEPSAEASPVPVLSEVPPMRDWSAMREWCRDLLAKRTGESTEVWNARVAERRIADERSLRDWLASRGVSGYAQSFLVWERFGYPAFLIDEATALIDHQYASRPHLRRVLDALFAALPDIGDTVVQARRTQVSLVGPRRTFAIVQATTRTRVDVALRLSGVAPSGRLCATRGDVYPVRLELRTPEDLDADARGWLKRAYDANAAPPPRRTGRPRPRVRDETLLRMAIEGVDLPGARCNPDAGGHAYVNVHAGVTTSVPPNGGPRVVPVGRRHVVDIVRGDAQSARWDFNVTLRRYDDQLDIVGENVGGPRGRRTVGLAWGEVTEDGAFVLFRGLGLRFADIDPALIDEAARTGARLVAHLRLTDARGNPRCASVRPPDVSWLLEPPTSPRIESASSPRLPSRNPARRTIVQPPRRARR